MLRGLREGFPDWGDIFSVCHLHRVKQLSEVHPEVICRTLILFLIPNPLGIDPRLPQIHYHLSYRFGDTGSCHAVDAWVEDGQMAQE